MDQLETNHLLNYFSVEELQRICEIEDLYLKSKIIVYELFKDKVDKGGKPYIGHLLRVSDRLEETTDKVAGLLHDTLEDTDITYQDLINVGFTREILDVVRIVSNIECDKSKMTKEEKLHVYYQEIDSIINSGNIHAIRVKEADMSDNYDSNRLKSLSEEQQAWFHRKYGTQIKRLRRTIASGR